ncbi:DUF72 domain-containing protein [Jatrophihabitans telluris]|uniref:DUF72 domain-containing protein n=1 Tax=Jatrophihabitans telluris TaxID=2038343 RepID=A0ABY4QZY4_9ACTN|nr:DUF72 domain-containing protein [Jatrophihabitans telluris]UQX89078.1 DUF72 domain-containing protein [Jatrophihabitans telluris]
MSVRVGISGWVYPPWRGDFYPPELVHANELAYAARRMTSIEINGSFYALQRPTSFYRWAREVPDDFVFSVKAGRFITHMKKLRNLEDALPNFFASGLLALQDKLGPLLWQLPPNLGFDAARMESFFAQLPRSTAEAAYLARHHDERLAGRAWTGSLRDRPLRHAVEVRHDSFKDPAFLELARAHCVAVVVADTAGKWPMMFDVTADFLYLRLHGADELYVSGYGTDGLQPWAGRIRGWRDSGLDVYVYFDNDTKVRSPYDAMTLIGMLDSSA